MISSAAQALAEIIVRVAFEFERHAARHERAETLARAAGEFEMNRVVRQAVRPVLLRDFAAGDRADDAIDVADGQFGAHFFAALNRRFANVQQLRHVERFLDAVILVNLPVAADFRPGFGLVQNRREVEALRLPMLDGLPRHELVGAADHFVERAEAELRHDLAQFLGDEPHEIDDVVRARR